MPYFTVQSHILVHLLSVSQCGDCKVQEIWDSTSVICDFRTPSTYLMINEHILLQVLKAYSL